MKHAATKEGVEYHVYKIKFMNGASKRNELFAELKDLLDRLKSLLSTSDEVSQLIQDRVTRTRNSAVNAAICNFWVQANKVFHALTSVWHCCCPHRHSARLLLQHPEFIRKDLDFEVMIARSLASTWEVYRTRIVQTDGLEASQAATPSQPSSGSAMRVPNHGNSQPVRSAMRLPRQFSGPTGVRV